MPTKKEKALVRELLELAFEINEQGKFDAVVEVRAAGVEFRISSIPYRGIDWSFYGEDTPYFKRGPWTEADFAKRIGVFIDAAKKHHAGYDDEGQPK